MKSLWATIVQINSVYSKANAYSALVPTGWERLKEVTLLSFYWHPLLFLHKASKAPVSKACLSPCSASWKLSDVPVFAGGSRQGSTVTLMAGVGLAACRAPRAELPAEVSQDRYSDAAVNVRMKTLRNEWPSTPRNTVCFKQGNSVWNMVTLL